MTWPPVVDAVDRLSATISGLAEWLNELGWPELANPSAVEADLRRLVDSGVVTCAAVLADGEVLVEGVAGRVPVKSLAALAALAPSGGILEIEACGTWLRVARVAGRSLAAETAPGRGARFDAWLAGAVWEPVLA